ncbi:MAG: hypothetical protein EA389_06850 [Ilumatobacter sp.]|nr:MAG: hypothetical protein EA389_06850 [Ilumatobacter sp.]
MTIGFGAVLVALGIIGFVGSGADSVTALIPSFFGVVFVVLGTVGRSDDRRALTMHIAAFLALVGIAGSITGLVDLPDLLAGNDLERPWAVAVQSIMAVVLVIYLVLAVRSFIAARRARG